MKPKHENDCNAIWANDIIDELRVIARDTRNIANNEFQSALSQVDWAWSGENSQGFLCQGYKLKSDIQMLAVNIDKTANTIEEIIRMILKEEEEAVRTAG